MPDTLSHRPFFHEADGTVHPAGAFVLRIHIQPEAMRGQFGKSHTHDLANSFTSRAHARLGDDDTLQLNASVGAAQPAKDRESCRLLLAFDYQIGCIRVLHPLSMDVPTVATDETHRGELPLQGNQICEIGGPCAPKPDHSPILPARLREICFTGDVPSDESAERLRPYRNFFAQLITANAGVSGDGRIKEAFASTPRERFLDSGPWRVFTPDGYIQSPTDDPTFLYQDIIVGLEDKGVANNGLPTLHASCLAAVNVQEGETVVQIGAGFGYYTAVLSKLTGPAGVVYAFEIKPERAERAVRNLADLTNVTLYNRSATDGPLPCCDVIYVNAGATAPPGAWLDALRPGGRLLLPLTTDPGTGGILLAKRVSADLFEARFLTRTMFLHCAGGRDGEIAQRLTEAFGRDDIYAVRSLRRNSAPDETCWFAWADGWLSTAPVS